MELLTKPFLLKALEKAGLPHTYKTLLLLEKRGVLNRGGGEVKVSHQNRFYTREEIAEAVQKVKQYYNK